MTFDFREIRFYFYARIFHVTRSDAVNDISVMFWVGENTRVERQSRRRSQVTVGFDILHTQQFNRNLRNVRSR